MKGGVAMWVRLVVADGLVARARAVAGVREMSGLVRVALTALVARESARRLPRLGGREPGLGAGRCVVL